MTQLQEDYTDVNDYFCRTLNQSKFSQCKIMKGNVKYKIYKHTIIYILLNSYSTEAIIWIFHQKNECFIFLEVKWLQSSLRNLKILFIFKIHWCSLLHRIQHKSGSNHRNRLFTVPKDLYYNTIIWLLTSTNTYFLKNQCNYFVYLFISMRILKIFFLLNHVSMTK